MELKLISNLKVTEFWEDLLIFQDIFRHS